MYLHNRIFYKRIARNYEGVNGYEGKNNTNGRTLSPVHDKRE